MPIEYHVGDLLLSDCNVIAHGCNCWNVMGAGIAKAIRATYPQAYIVDCKTIPGDRNKLGCFTRAVIGNRVIYNLYTQYNTASHLGECVLDYDALRNAIIAMLEDLKANAKDISKAKIGLPRIGCGLAGGDWKRVELIIDSIFQDFTVHIYSL